MSNLVLNSYLNFDELGGLCGGVPGGVGLLVPGLGLVEGLFRILFKEFKFFCFDFLLP